MKKMKGIRGLAALLVIALALVLLPVQEAKANYVKGDPCPSCLTGRLSIDRNNEGFYHYYVCDNPDFQEFPFVIGSEYIVYRSESHRKILPYKIVRSADPEQGSAFSALSA